MISVIGECLIELNGEPFGVLRQSFGGDTLNTAVYLARLTRGVVEVQYLSSMGVDDLSERMLREWHSEGIDTSGVLRDPTRLPGLYLIQVDEHGERTFLYWRGESAARYLLRHPEFERVAGALARADLIYLSGISLAILPSEDRATLVALLLQLAADGKSLVLENNYRTELWCSIDAARSAMTALVPSARLFLTTFNDEQRLWGDGTPDVTRARLHAAGAETIVVKLGAAGCQYSAGTVTHRVAPAPVTRVVDSTAAGDAFNAAFIAGWLTGCNPRDCCRLGNALAGIVLQHHGAIIPMAATPSLRELLERLDTTEIML